MNTPEVKYDGQIVNVAKGPIERSEARYYHHGINEIEPYQLLNRADNLRKRKLMDLEGELAETVFPGLDAKIKALREEHGDEIVDAILEGKLKISFLLNSTNGELYSGDHRKRINTMIKRQGGTVETYLKYACGPAAEIFLQGDERIITSDAILCASFYVHGDPDFNQERNNDLIWSIVSKTPKELREELSERIRMALENSKGDRTLVFNSAQMERFGLSTKVVSTLEDLKGEFVKRTGVTLLPDHLSSPFEKKIKAFFQSSSG